MLQKSNKHLNMQVNSAVCNLILTRSLNRIKQVGEVMTCYPAIRIYDLRSGLGVIRFIKISCNITWGYFVSSKSSTTKI